ncbi:MAG: PrgI family protein [Candidatus Levybacteria bacterium]|nr:PrgI family protein [Candidatus Levybacteria bacterium]
MDNHPIPQDITGFQFKLIGNMTIKQFAYLAAGTVLAWFCFFILPLFIVIRLPLAIIFLALGIGLAFVPIDGRPMDVMIINLIKAMFAPTQYIYRKNGVNLASNAAQAPQAQPQNTILSNYPAQVNAQPTQTPIQVQQPILQPSQSILQPLPQAATPISQPLPVQPQDSEPGKVIELPDNSQPPVISGNLDDLINAKAEEAEEKIEENEKKLEAEVSTLQKELEEAKALENTETNITNAGTAHQKTQELEKALIEASRQREELEKELLALKAKLEGQTQPKFNPGTVAPLPQTQRVRKVPPGMEKSVGVPTAPQDPNLITGIVKDPRNNPLPNILVEVKDPEDNPVRAFKTNGLGQFAAATTLANGKYLISFEDPKGQNKFDTVEIEANGTLIMPLEIISVDPREELRRELFN